jgi:hypothetical protein
VATPQTTHGPNTSIDMAVEGVVAARGVEGDERSEGLGGRRRGREGLIVVGEVLMRSLRGLDASLS